MKRHVRVVTTSRPAKAQTTLSVKLDFLFDSIVVGLEAFYNIFRNGVF